MNNFPTAENIWFVEAHTCFQLFNFVCLAAISLKVSAKLTRNKFKNITASYLLTSYIISSVRMLIMSNPVLFTMAKMFMFELDKQYMIGVRMPKIETFYYTAGKGLYSPSAYCLFLYQNIFLA